MEISNKETTLLGLLSEEPMHAYKITQEIECRSMREWTEISVSSVYKLLRKLEKDGLIESETKLSQKNLSQKIYTITPSGREALKEKVAQLISEPEKMIYRVDLATSNLGVLSKSEAIESLQKYQTALEVSLKCYVDLEVYLQQQNCPAYRFALARRPQYLLKGEIEWVKGYLTELLGS